MRSMKIAEIELANRHQGHNEKLWRDDPDAQDVDEKRAARQRAVDSLTVDCWELHCMDLSTFSLALEWSFTYAYWLPILSLCCIESYTVAMAHPRIIG